MNGDRQTGKIKLWMDEKGYGFILPDNADADVFAHIKDVIAFTPMPDDRVSFTVMRDPVKEKWRAKDVRLLR